MNEAERTTMFEMPRTAQGRLVGFEGSVVGRVYPLSTGTFVIGRAETCDLPLTDAGVSRQHAKIVAEADAYTILDTESRNGTFVNGKPVRRATLQEGDELRICGAALRFTVQPPAHDEEQHDEFETGDRTELLDPSALPSFLPEAISPASVPRPTVTAPAPGTARPPTQPSVSTADVGMHSAVTHPRKARRPPTMPELSSSGLEVPPPTVSMDSVPAELRTLKIVVVVALVAALVAVGTAIGVVLVLRTTPPTRPVVVERPAPVPTAPVATAPVPTAAFAPAADPAVPVVAAPREPARAPAPALDAKPSDAARPKPKESARAKEPPPAAKTASEWLPARGGPEVVRAPAAGTVTAVEPEAIAGRSLVTLGETDVRATATGPVTVAVKVGDAVRKGQVLARIVDDRARAPLPAELVKRAQRGARVELQLSNGSTRFAVVDEVAGGVLFVKTDATLVTGIRFP